MVRRISYTRPGDDLKCQIGVPTALTWQFRVFFSRLVRNGASSERNSAQLDVAAAAFFDMLCRIWPVRILDTIC